MKQSDFTLLRENILVEVAYLLLVFLALLPDHFQLSLLRLDDLLQLKHLRIISALQRQLITQRLDLRPQHHDLRLEPITLQQLIEGVRGAAHVLLRRLRGIAHTVPLGTIEAAQGPRGVMHGFLPNRR